MAPPQSNHQGQPDVLSRPCRKGTAAQLEIADPLLGTPAATCTSSAGRQPSSFTAPLRHAPGNSIFVLPGDIISDSLLATGVWEAELTERLIEDARKGGLMVEVGANLGYFSLLWALLNPTNRVIALEPSPRNLGLFQRSIAASGLAPRIDLLPIAAGNAFGITAFDLGPDAQTVLGRHCA